MFGSLLSDVLLSVLLEDDLDLLFPLPGKLPTFTRETLPPGASS